MLRPNKWIVPLFVLVMCLAAFGQQQAPPSTSIGAQEPMSQPPVARPPAPPPQQAPQQAPQQQPAQQAPGNTQPANQPSNTVQVPAGQAQQGQSPDQNEGGVFVFKKRVEEVTLHATVIDDRQRMITNLDKNAFIVYEDGQPQKITSFRHDDVSVSIGF